MKKAFTVACGVIAALSFAWVAVGQEQDKGKKELEKLQGTWKTVASESEGQKIEAAAGVTMPTVTIDGDQYLVNYPQNQAKGRKLSGTTIKIDPSKKPKTIDFTNADGSDDGKPSKGIYQLDGDTLRICYNPDKDGERPTEFATKSGSRVRYIVLKRGKQPDGQPANKP
jgi:uncharacterized protein (TIGR03067 family)